MFVVGGPGACCTVQSRLSELEVTMSQDELKENPPGSNKAIAAGCTCPRIDNHYGYGFMINGERCFVHDSECPLHGKKEIVDVVEYD